MSAYVSTYVDVGLWAAVMNLSFFALTLFFFTLAACMQPGYIQNDGVEFMDMLNVIDSTQLCADCNTIRTSRSRHCSVCGHCVERFDHHCPWINNCVGVRNHNSFFAYLIFQALLLVSTLSLSVLALTRHLTTNILFNRNFHDLLPEELKSDIVILTFLITLICMTLVFSALVSMLLCVHIQNFCSGKTTIERHGKVGNDNDRESRIRNSGIQADMQVYRNSISRPSSVIVQAATNRDIDSDVEEEREPFTQKLLLPDSSSMTGDTNMSAGE